MHQFHKAHISRRRVAWQVLLVLVVLAAGTALVHGERFQRKFHDEYWESRMYFDHCQTHYGNLIDCFTGPRLYPGLYRPLSTASYYHLGMKVFGDRVEPFKVVSVGLYLVVGLLVFFLGRIYLPFAMALIPPLLVVTRLANADVLALSVEAQTLLATFLSLLMLYCFARSCRGEGRVFDVLAVVSFVLALLCKEVSVAMLAVVVVYGWLFDVRRRWRVYITPFAIGAVWACAYFFLYRGAEGYRVVRFAYSWAPGDVLRNYLYYALDSVNPLLVFGDQDVLEFAPVLDTIAGAPLAQAVMLLLIAATGVAVVANRRIPFVQSAAARWTLFGVAFFLITMVPYVILGERVMIRYSLPGHIGLALSVGGLLYLLQRRVRSAA